MVTDRSGNNGPEGDAVYIGLYGGTFNPIHFGHLRTAEEICGRFNMKEVVFIPSAIPPHKDKTEIIDPIHRLKMVNLAVTGNPKFSFSEIEIHRPGKSYTIDTVKALKENYPDDTLAFILGLDAFLEIETWHKHQDIFAECDFIVTSRPGAAKTSCVNAIPRAARDAFKRKGSAREFVHSSGRNLIFTEVIGLDISASRIRALVREGASIRYLLPRRVIEYIKEHDLYK
jgi:nicotinate-nucleotide adenylyltransferase